MPRPRGPAIFLFVDGSNEFNYITRDQEMMMTYAFTITILRDDDISNRAASAVRRQLVLKVTRRAKPIQAMRAHRGNAITAG